MNVKKIRFKYYNDEPIKLELKAKGEGAVTASKITLPTGIEIINPDQIIATITDKKTELKMELEVEKGIGYLPVEQRQKEKLAIGVIAVDAIFSPVISANFHVEDMRVGQRIDFNKITMEVQTDGSISPEEAMKKAGQILSDHFNVVANIEVPEVVEKKATKTKSKKKKV